MYDELLHAFKEAVIYALHTGRLSPICADFDVALIYAIGAVARAARDGARTGDLVREACWAFGQYAVRQTGLEDDPPALQNIAKREIQGAPDRSDIA
jgi:hypothetical protein